MDELEFSIMERRLANSEALRSLIETFQRDHRAQVQAHSLDWSTGRAEITRVALYHHGPDLSEIGTTWVSDLVAMNALRPFSPGEVEQILQAGAFLPASWKTTHMSADTQVWSIPWLAESLVLHYRRDALRTAGVDESAAFGTPEALFDTVQKLVRAGYDLPLALPASSDRNLLLHIAASWVWQAEGDFMTPDGGQVAFHQGRALTGFKAFFRLLHSLPAAGLSDLAGMGIANSFYSGRAPLAIAGSWLHPASAPASSRVPAGEWASTRLPGPSFVGGSNLVIWKHSRAERMALALIQYLTGVEQASRYGEASGILPARAEVYRQPRFESDPFLRTVADAMNHGRSFPLIPLWGLVEDRLSLAVAGIWDQLAADPQADVDGLVTSTLTRLARGLNLTLEQV